MQSPNGLDVTAPTSYAYDQQRHVARWVLVVEGLDYDYEACKQSLIAETQQSGLDR